MSHYQPLGFKPAYYWDESSGLKEDKPMLIKLVQSVDHRHTMLGKCPAVFGVTVGYTIPFQWQSHYVLWRVIPAGIELRNNQLIFTPLDNESRLKAIAPQVNEEQRPKEDQPKAAMPKPKPEGDIPPEKGKPTYVVKYLPLPLGKSQPPIEIGVTFLTQHHNHRVVWNVLPAGEVLANGLLLLDPWESDDEANEAQAAKSRWWQKG